MDLKAIKSRVADVERYHGKRYLVHISHDLGDGEYEALAIDIEVKKDEIHLLKGPEGVSWRQVAVFPSWFEEAIHINIPDDFPEEDIERAIEFINS